MQDNEIKYYRKIFSTKAPEKHQELVLIVQTPYESEDTDSYRTFWYLAKDVDPGAKQPYEIVLEGVIDQGFGVPLNHGLFTFGHPTFGRPLAMLGMAEFQFTMDVLQKVPSALQEEYTRWELFNPNLIRRPEFDFEKLDAFMEKVDKVLEIGNIEVVMPEHSVSHKRFFHAPENIRALVELYPVLASAHQMVINMALHSLFPEQFESEDAVGSFFVKPDEATLTRLFDELSYSNEDAQQHLGYIQTIVELKMSEAA